MTTATQIRKMAAIGVLCLLGFAEFATAAPLARVWDFPTTSALPQSLVADRNGKSYLYLAQKDDGLVVLDLAQGAGGPKAVAQLPIRAFGGLHAMNLVQDGDRLYVALGDLFAATDQRPGSLSSTSVSRRSRASCRCGPRRRR